MLTTAVIVMSVVGCGDGVVQCSPVSSPKTVWHSQTACERAIPGVLRRSMRMPYPVIAARCETKGTDNSRKAVIAAATNAPFKAVRIEPAVLILPGDQAPVAHSGAQSLAATLANGARSSYGLVRQGASGSYALLRNGATASYGALRHGLAVSADSTMTAVRKTADIVSGLVD